MESSRKQSKVLIVDDEPDINMLFKLTLENAGFVVDSYTSLKLSKVMESTLSLACLSYRDSQTNRAGGN
jgi:DNA-binding response OmpR family regulator